MSISNATIKYIKSLHLPKNRNVEKLYTIEGKKLVKEWIDARIPLKYLIIEENEASKLESVWTSYPLAEEIIITSQHNIDRISQLKNPSPYLAVATQSEQTSYNANEKKWTLALDRVQDPGNVGTIIRIADWYGIEQIIYQEGTADIYNPKVIQSSMGSILRTTHHKVDLMTTLKDINQPIYAAVMDGQDLYQYDRTTLRPGIILMGNEANGIDDRLLSLTSHSITIPKIGNAESLNVAVACGIICSHFCR